MCLSGKMHTHSHSDDNGDDTWPGIADVHATPDFFRLLKSVTTAMKHYWLGEDCRTGFGRMKHKVNKGEVLSSGVVKLCFESVGRSGKVVCWCSG